MTAIRVDSIVVDPTVAIRPLNEKHVNHLVKVTFDPGEVLPPIVVFYDGASYVLADGAHRLEAKRFAKTGRAEHAHIEADVRAGGVLDARAWACRANVEHGFGSRPLTRAERAEAVDGYLRAIHALGRHESDADVGRIFGVSYKTIERQRTHLQLARTIVQAPPTPRNPSKLHGSRRRM